MEAVEISPKSGVIMQTISERIVEFGGAALIADYGYERNSGYGISGPVSKFFWKFPKKFRLLHYKFLVENFW